MKVVILAGGFGTRISEESHLRPKPMIEIGDKPILWHIMKEYSHYGYNEFVICCGYKQHMIKEYFADYYLYNGDVTFDFGNENKMIVHNNEWEWGYRENDPLDGYDPYSNSKSCSELVTHSYINSFFKENGIAVSTARAGNVIGGGDFANDRIIPDCIRAAMKGESIIVRNPHSTRPYQHVLEPLVVYLRIAKEQYEDIKYAGFYNVGPDDCDCVTTGELVDLFCNAWGEDQTWENRFMGGPHEANFLKLDCSKIKQVFGWSPRWHVEEAVRYTVEWAKAWVNGTDVSEVMDQQIREFMNKGE